jgi:dienelactone hydrolase
MPEHILPLPPKWEKDLDCGWVVYTSGGHDIRGYFAKPMDGTNLPGIVMVPENLGIIEHRRM